MFVSNGCYVMCYVIKVDVKICKKYNFWVFFKNLGLLNVLLFFFFYFGELSLNVICDNGEFVNCVFVWLVFIVFLDCVIDFFVFNYDFICNFEELNRGFCFLKILF